MLRDIPESYLSLVLEWRNRPEVRRVMFSDHIISWEEHKAWWRSLQCNPDKRTYLFCDDEKPVGVVTFYGLENKNKEIYWGFFLGYDGNWSNEYRLKIWLSIEEEAIRHAFSVLNCNHLLCESMEFNTMVLEIHEKFGFRLIKVFEREKYGKPQKVALMGLKKIAWQHHSRSQSENSSSTISSSSISFLGSANWDTIAMDFADRYKSITHEKLIVQRLPFSQYRQLILDENSDFRKNPPGYLLFCERLEDLFDSPQEILEKRTQDLIEYHFNEYMALLNKAREIFSATFLVLDFAPVRPISATLEEASYIDGSLRNFINKLNERLQVHCNSIPNCNIIRLSALLDRFGAKMANPGKYWHIGRMPYSMPFGKFLNEHVIGNILALRGKTARAIVVDLDNTLWKGTVGDDGLDGILLGGDFPGNVYVEIQNTIKSLKNRGFVLNICSRNTEEIAISAMREHPNMLLKPEEFAVIKINWEDKTKNIQQIAEELNLGLGNICVIDDSPYERAAIRKILPEVIVPELPADPCEWSEFLLNFPYFAQFKLTKEDLERTERYQIRARINQEACKYTNKEDFLRGLNMHLYLHQYLDKNKSRIIQLLAKTNQFNMTTKRYSESDLKELIAEGCCILGAGLADKYSSEEIIGVLILRFSKNFEHAVQIDSFLLSCRVLGRNVETALLGWICQYVKRKNYNILEGHFIKTARNKPAISVYKDHEFEPITENIFRLDLRQKSIAIPTYFEIHEDLD